MVVSEGRLKTFRKWAARAIVVGAVAVAGLYASSSHRPELLRGLMLGYRPDFAFLSGRIAERVIVSQLPLIVADHYPKESARRPLVVLVHGSVSEGRRHATTRLLAQRLVQVGFPVLAIDLRGFGESEKLVTPLARTFTFKDDVVTAARYAVDRGYAAPGEIVYMGFSLGAKVVLEAGRFEPRPAAIVAFGGGDTKARFARGGEAWRRRFARKFFEAMGIEPDEQSLDVMGKYLVEIDVVRQVSLGELPPVLLIYGERDSSLPTIQEREAEIDSLFELRVIPKAIHNLYISGIGRVAVAYNETMLGQLIRGVESWVPNTESPESR